MDNACVTIITTSFNSSKTISESIFSVVSQSYPNIEYILIDGASTDGTIDIIKSYGSRITKLVSEPDFGIYHAMNKGLKLATGDIIGILNSDDLYIDENVISMVVDQFNKSDCDSLYGDLYYVFKENTNIIVRQWISKQFILGSFKQGWHPPHPTFFVRKQVYEKYGYFNLQLKLAADFELMLRFLEKFKVSTYYIPRPLVKMRLGGATNNSFKNIFIQNIECYQSFKKNNLSISIFYPFKRLFPKILQFIKR